MTRRRVVDIEEDIYSSCLGLKGKIDASVHVQIHRRGPTGTAQPEDVVVPLELKTGKAATGGTIKYRAQVLLYTLMMEERHRRGVDIGLLHYLKSGEVYGWQHVSLLCSLISAGIPAARRDLQGLIGIRNDIARFIEDEHALPPMIHDLFACTKRCFMVDRCCVHHKAAERGTEASSGIGVAFAQRTAHLTESAVAYYERWNRMLTIEGEVARSQRDVCAADHAWTQHSRGAAPVV